MNRFFPKGARRRSLSSRSHRSRDPLPLRRENGIDLRANPFARGTSPATNLCRAEDQAVGRVLPADVYPKTDDADQIPPRQAKARGNDEDVDAAPQSLPGRRADVPRHNPFQAVVQQAEIGKTISKAEGLVKGEPGRALHVKELSDKRGHGMSSPGAMSPLRGRSSERNPERGRGGGARCQLSRSWKRSDVRSRSPYRRISQVRHDGSNDKSSSRQRSNQRQRSKSSQQRQNKLRRRRSHDSVSGLERRGRRSLSLESWQRGNSSSSLRGKRSPILRKSSPSRQRSSSIVPRQRSSSIRGKQRSRSPVRFAQTQLISQNGAFAERLGGGDFAERRKNKRKNVDSPMSGRMPASSYHEPMPVPE